MKNSKSGASETCPLCGRETATAADLRMHLLCNHRKSELVDDLLGTQTRESPPMP
jgi:hypothetical protein